MKELCKGCGVMIAAATDEQQIAKNHVAAAKVGNKCAKCNPSAYGESVHAGGWPGNNPNS